MNKKKIVLFDIDYTLFNTEEYRSLVKKILAEKASPLHSEKFKEIFQDIVLKARQEKYFDYPKQFAQLFVQHYPHILSEKAIEEMWWQKEIFQQAIYPETIKVLQQLQKSQWVLGIFSSGKTEFQLAKISSIQDFFQQKHIRIAYPKDETLPELIREYKEYEVVLVDDYIDILEKAKALNPDITTVWVKRGRYAEHATLPKNFAPDATITDLTQLLSIVDNQIGE